MGTNTMVAAVGLVIGPVLGGALVAISWHWVFWFNVPLGLAGALWGALVLHELAKPDSQRGLDLLGTGVFLTGLTGLVYGVSKGGLSGWSEPIVIAVPDRGGHPPAALRADREQGEGAHARPHHLPQPAVRGGHRRRLHQRALALRPALPLRLLLPGRAGRRSDHGRDQALPDGHRDARSPRRSPGSGRTAGDRERSQHWGCSSRPSRSPG